MMLIYGLLQVFTGLAACACGTQLMTQTAQYPGNTRIRVGSIVSFLGSICFTFGGLTVVMSL
jgi:hypothetical protein